MIFNVLERHRDKWREDGDCYRWIGAGSESGRPVIGIGGKKIAIVARLVCEEAHGPAPPGKPLALHDTPNGCIGGACVNGEHLRWGNKYENSMDIPTAQREAIAAHARLHIPPGPRNERKERTAARAKGESTYFTGKPCKNGHVSPRYTIAGDCVACRSEWNARRIR